MIYDRLRIFVSSRMEELAPERAAIRAALADLQVDGWLFEEDGGARSRTIQQTYQKEIDAADLYIGLFWRGYGDYTIDEFNCATEKNKDRLIYEKRAGIDGLRDARLQAFLDQIAKVESGLTIRWFNTPEELGEAIKQDTARWQAEKVRELRAQNVNNLASPAAPEDQRALKILRAKVKSFWIEGVLDRSIQREHQLELGKDKQREAVENPWEAVIELPYEGARAVLANEGILDVFDSVQNSLLILGQPGSGKTTTLLILARELISRAERNAAQPVPVIFNLSSWTNPDQPLAAWLESELNAKYQIPIRIGKGWLEHNRLLLLLDGLDEVKSENRKACAEAINRLVKEIGVPGLVVCCRVEQYEELNVKLALSGAISLRPLTDAQIASYVGEAGAALVGLGNALRKDPVLQELARSPLLLNLMCLAYRDLDATDLEGRESMADRTRHLFTTYVDRMFAKRGKAELAFPREQTLAYLSWIARSLSGRNQAMFLMEELQPGWLSTGAQRWAYLAGAILVIGLLTACANIAYWSTSSLGLDASPVQAGEIIWLVSMPAWFLAIGWVETIGAASNRPVLEQAPAGIRRALLKALICGVALALIVGAVSLVLQSQDAPGGNYVVMNLIWAGVPIVFLLSAKGRDRSIFLSIKTVESVGWSPAVAWRGALLGLLGGLAAGAFVYLPIQAFQGIDSVRRLVFCLGFGTVCGALGALLGGLESRVVKGKTGPNQGIRYSLRMALLMGLNAIWLVAMVVVFAKIGRFSTAASLPAILGYLAGMFLAFFFWFGGIDVLKHYVLRAVLTASGQLPWKLDQLLDHARDLDLMQKVGNGYIFMHRRLLEHLAVAREKA